MTQKSVDLDTAIDVIAKQLSRVEDDPQFASRIVMALPERVTWFGWLMHSWAPRLAMVAIVVVAGIVWGDRRGDDARPVEPLASPQTVTPMVATVQAAPARTQPVELVEPVEPVELVEPVKRFEPARPPDFDRSLPALSAMQALELDWLAPVSLPEDAPLTLTPLAIESLPLTDDSFPPHR